MTGGVVDGLSRDKTRPLGIPPIAVERAEEVARDPPDANACCRRHKSADRWRHQSSSARWPAGALFY